MENTFPATRLNQKEFQFCHVAFRGDRNTIISKQVGQHHPHLHICQIHPKANPRACGKWQEGVSHVHCLVVPSHWNELLGIWVHFGIVMGSVCLYKGDGLCSVEIMTSTYPRRKVITTKSSSGLWNHSTSRTGQNRMHPKALLYTAIQKGQLLDILQSQRGGEIEDF